MHSFTTVFWYILFYYLYLHIRRLAQYFHSNWYLSKFVWMCMCLLVNSLLFSWRNFFSEALFLSVISSYSQNSVSSPCFYWCNLFFGNTTYYPALKEIFLFGVCLFFVLFVRTRPNKFNFEYFKLSVLLGEKEIPTNTGTHPSISCCYRFDFSSFSRCNRPFLSSLFDMWWWWSFVMSLCVCVLFEMKLEMIYLCQEEHTGKVTGNG